MRNLGEMASEHLRALFQVHKWVSLDLAFIATSAFCQIATFGWYSVVSRRTECLLYSVKQPQDQQGMCNSKNNVSVFGCRTLHGA